MASLGKRVKTVLGKLMDKDPQSIQDTDRLGDYGFSRSNLFSLFEKVEEELYEDILHLDISQDDIIAIGNLQTVKDLEDLIGKMSRKESLAQGGRSDGSLR